MGESAGYEVIPLTSGAADWVFPDVAAEDAGPIWRVLTRADGEFRRLTEHLGAGTAPAGEGLTFRRLPGFDVPERGIFGVVEVAGVIFQADLYFPRRCAWDGSFAPPWQVSAEVRAECDQAVDCGALHIATEIEVSCDSHPAAAEGLLEAVTWLAARRAERPLEQWRALAGGHFPGRADR